MKEIDFQNSEYAVVQDKLMFETIRLEIKKICAQQMIDPSAFLSSSEISHFHNEFGRKMVYQMMAKVASKKYDVKTVIFPLNWWESFKKRWFPLWAKSRWPVKYTEVTLEANAYYPDLQIPDHQAFVEIMVNARNY